MAEPSRTDTGIGTGAGIDPGGDAAIAVVGGGLGGVAAALAVARAGGRVVLLEASDQLGGQLTRQAVTPLDEHALIETCGAPASYRRLRDTVRAHYRREAPPGASSDVWRNPGDGWVSRLCFEPAVGQAVIDAMVAEQVATGRLQLRLGTRVTGVGRDGVRITHLDLVGPDGVPDHLDVAVVLDATELGDLLPLAAAPWVTGAEARADTGEALAPEVADPTRTQAITVVAMLRRDPAPGPVVARPSGYDRWRASQPFTLDVPAADGTPRRFGMFTPVPGGPPPFWTYRRVRSAAAFGGPELACINWPGNDHVDRDLLGADDPDAVIADARRLTLAFVHWLQTEAPRDDGGTGHPELQLAPEPLGTPDGLAAEPYVREARRLRARTRVVAEDILPDVARGARGRPHRDTGGVGWYPMDVHASVGEPASRNDPTAPFQVPLSAMVPAGPGAPVNLLAAGKAVGTTHLSNGAYRVHPVEWAIGEAAGTLALVAARAGVTPGAVLDDPSSLRRTQARLVAGGAELAWLTDVAADDPRWAGAQLLAAAGALEGPGLRHHLDVTPDLRLDPADREAVLAARGRLRQAAGLARSATSARTFGDLAVEASEVMDALLASGASSAATPPPSAPPPPAATTPRPSSATTSRPPSSTTSTDPAPTSADGDGPASAATSAVRPGTRP
jgi:hypothetical protein